MDFFQKKRPERSQRLGCVICQEGILTTEVRMFYLGSNEFTMNSFLQAWRRAEEEKSTPCKLVHVYKCQKCVYEEIKGEYLCDKGFLTKLK